MVYKALVFGFCSYGDEYSDNNMYQLISRLKTQKKMRIVVVIDVVGEKKFKYDRIVDLIINEDDKSNKNFFRMLGTSIRREFQIGIHECLYVDKDKSYIEIAGKIGCGHSCLCEDVGQLEKLISSLY